MIRSVLSQRTHTLVVGLAMLIASCTTTAESHAYRTGIENAPNVDFTTWGQLPVMFEVAVGERSPVSPSDFLTSVIGALEVWRTPECSKWDYELVEVGEARGVSGDGRSTIDWVSDGWNERGFDTDAVGMAELIYLYGLDNQWSIVEADVHLNAEALESRLENGEAVSIDAILIHELGHTLGLLHPCENATDCTKDERASVMVATYSDRTELSSDDIAGVCFLYGDTIKNLSCGDDCEGLSQPPLVPICDEDDGGCRTVALRNFGEGCLGSEECVSGSCLMVEDDGMCTRECGSGSTCPVGWECGQVEGSNVCTPPVEDEKGCSCMVPTAKGAKDSYFTWVLLTGLVVGLAGRRVIR